MKLNFFLLVFLLNCVSLNADQMPSTKTKYQIIDDSVHFTDGRVISFEEFSKNNQQLDSIHLLDGSVYSKEEYIKMLPFIVKKIRNGEKVNNNENKEGEKSSIIPSWKFYTLMLAFPGFLILLFVLVVIRGRKGK